MSLILAFVAIVFLISGFALIINGYLESPAVDKVVPIEDLESVEAKLATSREQEKELKSRLDSMVLVLDESRANAEKMPQLEQEIQSLQSLQTESQKKNSEREKDLQFLRHKADSQAQESLEVIEILSNENAKLKSDIQLNTVMVQKESAEQVASAHEMVDRLQQENSTFQNGIQNIVAKIQAIDDGVANMKQDSEAQLSGIRQTIAALTTEKQELQQQVAVHLQTVETVNELRKDLQESDARVAEANNQVAQLQSRLQALDEQMNFNNEKMKDLQERLLNSQRENEQAQSSLTDLKQNPPVASAPTIDSNQDGLHKAWELEREAMQSQLEQLREQTDFLLEKEKKIQLELSKARAQSLGWQKVYQELKTQVEKSNPKISS